MKAQTERSDIILFRVYIYMFQRDHNLLGLKQSPLEVDDECEKRDWLSSWASLISKSSLEHWTSTNIQLPVEWWIHRNITRPDLCRVRCSMEVRWLRDQVNLASPFLRVDLRRFIRRKYIRAAHKTTWVEYMTAGICYFISVIFVRKHNLETLIRRNDVCIACTHRCWKRI